MNIPLIAEFQQPPAGKRYQQIGFSLLELMVSIAFLILTIGLAAPSFASFINRSEVAVDASKLFSSLQFARSKAIHRHQIIHVCQLSDDTDTCEANYSSKRSWANGWMIFADINGDNNFSSADDLLRVERLQDNTRIVFNQRGRLRFFPNGGARSAGFYICDKDSNAHKRVYLLYSGRARLRDDLSQRNQAICSSS